MTTDCRPTFWDSWDFFTAPDPTHGYITYVDQQTCEVCSACNFEPFYGKQLCTLSVVPMCADVPIPGTLAESTQADGIINSSATQVFMSPDLRQVQNNKPRDSVRLTSKYVTCSLRRRVGAQECEIEIKTNGMLANGIYVPTHIFFFLLPSYFFFLCVSSVPFQR